MSPQPTLTIVSDADKTREQLLAELQELKAEVAILRKAEVKSKSIAKAFRESEERLRLAQQVARAGTFEWNIRTGANTWTPELEAMYGLPPGGFPGTQEAWEQLVYPEDRPEAVRRVREAMDKGDFEGEWRVIWPDGTIHWLYGRAFVFKDESGKPLKLIGINIDITGHKQIEEELRRSRDELEQRVQERARELQESEKKYRIMADNTYDWEFWLDPEGNFVYTSPSCERETGYTVGEYTKNPGLLIEITHPDDKPALQAHVHAWQPSSYGELEFRIIARSGEVRWIHHLCQPIYDKDGNFLGNRGSNRDITRRKRAEDALKEAKQQAELYVDLICHDINNMNQSAMGYLELALQALDTEKRLRQDDRALIEKPIRSLANSSALIDNVRKLQRLMAEGIKAGPTDLQKIFKELEAIDFGVQDRDVVINIHQVQGVMVEANELLKDVFINLISNAIKHSDQEKPLTINVNAVQVIENGKDYYACTVEDNGPGIPDEMKPKLFHRFQRGKTRAHGKGLGLYIVRTLVEGYHGKVRVEDRVPGDHTKGARFVVMLPAANK